MTERVKWALISVYEKRGIVEFARRLVSMGWKILASGGTAKALDADGVPVKDVAELVGGGAILGHRVVTLSREVHAGLLADPNKPEDMAELAKLGIPFIHLVCCDFYPLAEETEKPDATVGSVIEKTDIGGPTMVRSAAKGGRIVICRPEDREWVLKELEQKGVLSPEGRQRLRAIAEFEVARYVADSARFHSGGDFESYFGERVAKGFKAENGWQRTGSLFKNPDSCDQLGLPNFRIVDPSTMQPMSWNNWCDLDRLLQTMTHICAASRIFLDGPPDVAVGVKHGNACGAAVGITGPSDAVENAVRGDTLAMFGGSFMCNFPLSEMNAQIMVTHGMPVGTTQKFDTVFAPGFDEGAIEILSRKHGKCRLVVNPALDDRLWCKQLDRSPRFRHVRGGFMVQPNYTFVPDFEHLEGMKVYGERAQSNEWNLALAWAIGSTSNSNTITLVAEGMLIGNGVGQQDRVGAAKLAIERAIRAGHESKLRKAVACSDSFFPFPDAPKVLIDAGIRAIFSTSGSQNDAAVIELCKKRSVTLYMMPDPEARGFFGH
jgi:phosphoribosylaminoimidazolecarboxamide formyltransferase/IMP cyclohydrolase